MTNAKAAASLFTMALIFLFVLGALLSKEATEARVLRTKEDVTREVCPVFELPNEVFVFNCDNPRYAERLSLFIGEHQDLAIVTSASASGSYTVVFRKK